MNPLLEAALRYTSAGLSVLPTAVPSKENPKNKGPAMWLLPRIDGKKTWSPFMDRLAYEEELRKWFERADPKEVGIGIIAGRVSGNLEILDIDDKNLVLPWFEMVRRQDEDLVKRLVVEKTPRGGAHIYYRCRVVIGQSQVLARGPRTEDGQQSIKTLLETRGEQAYAVAAPSKGYSFKNLEASQVAAITAEERDILLSSARALDECPVEVMEPYKPKTKNKDISRPGDDVNNDLDFAITLLNAWGWETKYTNGQVSYWRRPGKTKGGISATLNHIPGKFHVFSSNAAPLEAGSTYDIFALYTVLEHQGDFAKAAATLRKCGRGLKDPLEGERPIEEEPEIDPRKLPPASLRDLSLAPDIREAKEARALAKKPPPPIPRDDPLWEPGMDDPDEDEEADAAMPSLPPEDIIQFPVHPTGYGRITDNQIIEYALGGEQGLGKLVAIVFKDRLLFDHSTRTWYKYDGCYWRECLLNEPIEELDYIRKLIVSVAVRKRPKTVPMKGRQQTDKVRVNGGQNLDRSELVDLLLRAASSLQRLGLCQHVLEFAAAGIHGLGTSGEEWDQDMQFLLPCSNGVVNLRTGELRPSSPADRFRTVCPTRYNPAAKAPRWEQFIKEIMPDEETGDFLRRLLGYAMTGSVSEHVFPVFYGKAGRNGKDTLTETIYSIMGPMATPVSAKTLMKTHFSPEHDSAMLDLRGRRFAWASESEDGQHLDTAKVKLWTGGGALKGRPPYGSRQITFAPTHKLFLISNFKPKVPPDDAAFWRRMVLIPFNYTFVEEPLKPNERLIDTKLREKLALEKEGILAWLVRACIEWQERGLSKSTAVRKATSDYRDEEDIIGEFMAKCLVADPFGKLSGKVLYAEYTRWMQESDEKPMGYKKFCRTIRDKGYDAQNRGNGVEVRGYILAPVSSTDGV